MDVVTKAKNLAFSLFERLAWESQCKPLLKKEGIQVGLGSKATLIKLYSAFEANELLAEKFCSKFEDLYFDLLFSGDKTVQLYSLESDSFNRTLNSYSQLEPDMCAETSRFPFLMKDSEVSLEDNTHKLVHVEKRLGKVYFFLSVTRKIKETKELDFDDLGDTETVRNLKTSRFSKITAISESPRQYIDVVCLNPLDNTLELRLDTSGFISRRDIDSLFKSLKEAYIYLGGNKLKFKLFDKPLNLFPMINKLYRDETCRVCELSFTTVDGFTHTEKDRRKSKGGDVRKGEFHIGGSSACEVDPYRISCRWSSHLVADIKYEYELSLNSSQMELSRPEAGFLDHLIITMCPNPTNMDKLLTYMKSANGLSKAS